MTTRLLLAIQISSRCGSIILEAEAGGERVCGQPEQTPTSKTKNKKEIETLSQDKESSA